MRLQTIIVLATSRHGISESTNLVLFINRLIDIVTLPTLAREPVVEIGSITSHSKIQKLVSVDRAFEELQNDTLFSGKLFRTGGVPSKIHSCNLKVPIPVL